MTFLCIVGDPGSRNHFVAGWILDNLHISYDHGYNRNTFLKYHPGINSEKKIKSLIEKYNVIRILPRFKKIDLHLFLFLTKNIYKLYPQFVSKEYDIETFYKVFCAAKEWFSIDKKICHLNFHYEINFEDTFDLNFMINLYETVNNKKPTQKNINKFIECNELNSIMIPQDHSCSLAKLVLDIENNINFDDSSIIANNRWGFIKYVYDKVPVGKRYDMLKKHLTEKFYCV